jgi:hypothetical protein
VYVYVLTAALVWLLTQNTSDRKKTNSSKTRSLAGTRTDCRRTGLPENGSGDFALRDIRHHNGRLHDAQDDAKRKALEKFQARAGAESVMAETWHYTPYVRVRSLPSHDLRSLQLSREVRNRANIDSEEPRT